MTNRAYLIASIALLGLAGPARADDFQQWLMLPAKVDLSDKVVVQNELFVRFSDDRGGLYEIENTLALGYKLPGKVVVSAGYTHNPQYDAGDFTVMERRAREQVAIDDFARIGPVSLSVRLRFEQRWRDGVDGTRWRARPYIKLAIPLGGKGGPTFNLSEEAFFNLNNTSFQSKDGLDRLRTAAAVSFPVSPAVKLEVGYLNQYRFVSGGPDEADHAATASVGLSF